jgi:putative FmdB family regulatory protein
MPIYEYACSKCGQQKEVFHRMSESPVIECEHCEGEHLQKLISAAGFRLKGGGWYETDFKSSNQRNLVGDGAAAAKDSGSDAKPAAAKTEATPAATPKPKPEAAA